MIILTADVEGLTQSRGHLSEQQLKVSMLPSLWAVSAGPMGPQGGDGVWSQRQVQRGEGPIWEEAIKMLRMLG